MGLKTIVLPEKITFVGRTEEKSEIKRTINDYLRNNSEKSYLIDVYGISGVGKTTLLKMIKQEISNENEAIAIYVDTSADNKFIDILVKLRNELRLTVSKKDNKQFDSYFFVFDLLYNIFYNSSRIKVPMPLWEDFLKSTDSFFDIVFSNLKTINDRMSCLVNIIKILKKGYDYFKDWSDIEDIINSLEKESKNYGGQLSSTYGRQNYLLKLFNKALREFASKHKIIIFLDNFRNNANKLEIYFDKSWFLSNQGLVNSVPGCFVIGEINPITNELSNQEGLDIEYQSILVKDLGYDDIVSFYKKSCGLFFNGGELSKVEKRMLIAALNSHEDNNEEEYDETDLKSRYYYPMYMRFIAEHYNHIRETKKQNSNNTEMITVTVDDLGRLDNLADLSYYFEMNMTEIKRDAFYILSCFNVWNEQWYLKVKERFDNYLLNAKHVLGNFSFVERIDYNELKLHDFVRKMLYKSSNNLIKYDVLEWMFIYFLHMQKINSINDISFKISNEDDELIYDIDELVVYTSICLEYIEGINNSKNNYFDQGNAMALFTNALEKSLKKYYSDYNTINDEIINLVKAVIEKFKKFNLECDEINTLNYRLGLLYSYKSANNGSLEQDKVTYSIVDNQCKNLPELSKRNLVNYIFKLSMKYMCHNAVGYSFGELYNYEAAAVNCWEALNEQYALLYEAQDYLDLTTMQKDAYIAILDFLNSSNNDISKESINKLLNNINIFKQSEYFKKYMSNWDNANFRDIFVPYTKIRSNLPWYYLHLSNEKKRDMNIYSKEFNPIYFAIKTYYLRYYLYGKSVIVYSTKHNISVYLFKMNYLREAMKLSDQVLEEFVKFEEKIIENNKDKKQNKDLKIKDKIEQLIALDLFPQEQLQKILKNNIKYLEFNNLFSEIIQYRSNYREQIAFKYYSKSKNYNKMMAKAIEEGLLALTLRWVKMNEHHEKIYDSLSYLSRYYYQIGKKDDAKKIIDYVVDKCEKLKIDNHSSKMSDEKISSYKILHDKIHQNLELY